MDYQHHYNALISRARTREHIAGYVELHHVIPRCIGGLDDAENLVMLTPEEHFLAHQLLVKIYPGNAQIVAAAWGMCGGNQKQQRNNKLYGWLRRKYSASKKGRTKENDPSVAAMAEKLRGRTKETHEYLQRLSEQRKGQTKENNLSVAKMAEKLRGRTKETHEGIARAAEKLRGRTKETHEGIARAAEKLRGRTKETDASVAKVAEKLRGRTKETHGHLRRDEECRRKLSEKKTGTCLFNAEQRQIIADRRNEGMLWREIQQYFADELGITVSYDFLRQTHNKMLNGFQFKE